jgi:sugar O-acyltransferase (sialic acid O-acetyltransferase NeuD family)
MRKKLIIFGDSAFAEIAYEYFTYDSDYTVVAFTVESNFLTKKQLFDLPVYPFEEIKNILPPNEYEMHIALTYSKLNRVRMKIYESAKGKGYILANYISSKSFVWKNVEIGDNVFIFENNTVQPFVKLGANIVLWSGNHIGHHSFIDSHNFISSQVVVSGFVNIGKANFIGVNSTIANNIEIGDDIFIGAGATISKSVRSGSFIYGNRNTPIDKTTYQIFDIDDELG